MAAVAQHAPAWRRRLPVLIGVAAALAVGFGLLLSVDPHRIRNGPRWREARLLAPARIEIRFTAGKPVRRPTTCWPTYSLRVRETDTTVVLAIREHRPFLSLGSCNVNDLGYPHSLVAELKQPLRGRRLIDGVTGSTRRATQPVEVRLWHCGIDTITVDDRRWEVPNHEEPFDGTSAPESFAGRGTIERVAPDELSYVDDSGLRLRFVPDDGVEPPCL
jgi:hypothetical protein